MNLPLTEFPDSDSDGQIAANTNQNLSRTMGLLLSEEDKLLILLVAFLLVVVTVVVTSCLVLPKCYLYTRFLRPKITGTGEKGEKKKAQQQQNASIVYPFFGGNGSRHPNESDHFHLSIVPVYGLQPETRSLASSPVKHPSVSSANGSSNLGIDGNSASVNQYENLTLLAEKTRLRYSSLKPDNLKALPCFPKVKARLRVELLDETTFRLHITIDQVTDLKLKEYLCEPSCYVTVTLLGYKPQRRSIINKATQSEIFRTETIKRTLNPVFGKTLRSEHLPRSLLKEGCIKVRVMDEERYANDVCLGEVSIALRKIGPLVREGEGNSNTTTTLVAIPPTDEQNNNCIMKKEAFKEKTDSADVCSFKNATSTDSSQLVPSIQVNGSEKVEEPSDEELMSTYTLFPIKEVKGDIFVGFCFLPTSKRINVTVVKANVRPGIVPTAAQNPNVHHAFYARILQFNNGRLVKKKKTGLSVRLSWGEHETVSFDLGGSAGSGSSTVATACEPLHLMSFMLVLCCKAQNSNTPSSPEVSPQTPEQQANNNAENVDTDESGKNRSSRRGSGSSRKDRIIGHFVLDHHLWMEEILRKPRKQIIKWHDLF